jgi:GNAT superfamily N-acetyltransferase
VHIIDCRSARFHEVPMAAELRQDMAVEMGANFDDLSVDWRTAFCRYFGGKQAACRAEIFLAFHGDEAVGCAIVSIIDDYRNVVFNTPSAFVNAVFVRPPYRRQGIARRLMELVIAWAREHGCIRVRLRSSDDGRALYTTMGFNVGREMELDL